jgi:hypothetical protein
MAVSLREFRDRFPDASILSDILMVQDQQYIVKVTVITQNSGTTTGLAAHKTLEIAEDQARQRAFQALGLGDIPASAETIPEAVQPSFSAHDEVNLAFDRDSNDNSAEEVYSNPQDRPTDTKAAPSANAVAAPTATQPRLTDTQAGAGGQPKPTKPKPRSVSKPTPPDESPSVPEPDSPALALDENPVPIAETTPAAPISPEALPAPINLSDVIAQTDIELRRLGWTVDMGREYLEQTYNKRSRHELSEEELIQFLCYLEGLPDPQKSL